MEGRGAEREEGEERKERRERDGCTTNVPKVLTRPHLIVVGVYPNRTGHAKVGYLAKVLIDHKDIAGSQVAVHKTDRL